MKVTPNVIGMIAGTVSGLLAIGIAFITAPLFQSPPVSGIIAPLVIPPEGTMANAGYKLFMFNCAHCHGTDAHGGEGPNLHGLAKSDDWIASTIQNGVKGEMPKFGTKLSDADVQAVIAFVRTLKE